MLAIIFAQGCADDSDPGLDSSGSDGDESSSFGDSSDSSNDGSLDLPATVTMQQSFSGGFGAALCNDNAPGHVGYTLRGDAQCGLGSSYLVFTLTSDGAYSLKTGGVHNPGELDTPVQLISTTHGTIASGVGESKIVSGLSGGVDVTIETQFHAPITFRFDGEDLTLLSFDAT